MRNDISIDMLIFIIIGLVLLVLVAFFVLNIYKGGTGASNESITYINSTFQNVTNNSIPYITQ